VTTIAAVAAVVSAVAASTTLLLYLRANRPSLEVFLQPDPAQGAKDGRAVPVFSLRVDNVGSAPARIRCGLVIDGSLVGEEGSPVRLPSPLHRTFALTVPVEYADRLNGLAARVRYGRWRSVDVGPGERKVV